MNCQDLGGTCEPDNCRCDQEAALHMQLIDSRLQELMEAVHAYQIWAEDLPTLARLKAIELYGAMLREQILNK